MFTDARAFTRTYPVVPVQITLDQRSGGLLKCE
jgi:hypothetical protein